MSKIKIASITATLLVAIGLSAGAYYYLQKESNPLASSNATTSGSSSVAANFDNLPAAQSIPLNRAEPAPDPNSLQVRSNSGFGSATQAAGTQQTLGQTTDSPKPAQNPFDPTTYKQYEKYKPETTALFSDVQVGTGATLGPKQQAAVYYRGWLTNGSKFDESRAGTDGRMEPFVFTLGEGRVIPGWEQGLAGMKVGGVRLLVVPPAAGYGSTGQGSIPPDSVLVFQVQLADVK